MKTFIYWIGICGALATAAVGCNAAEVTSDELEARGSDEDVAETAQELEACSPETVYSHGGNLWEQDYDKVLGCSCGPGYVRDADENTYVTHQGAGDCYFESGAVAWANTDEHDCHVKVHIHDSAGWAWGQCYVHIGKKEEIRGCFGHCGGISVEGCYCDSLCSRYGDCCPDKIVHCG